MQLSADINQTKDLSDLKSDVLRVLLIKPYQWSDVLVYSPPLGLLYLASVLREKFGKTIQIDILDMKLDQLEPSWLEGQLGSRYKPDIVGFSALNCEADATHQLAKIVKNFNSDIVTVLGGPYALHRAEEVFTKGCFDWIFNGAADRSFPEAINRFLHKREFGNDLDGFCYRHDLGIHISNTQDNIKDLDEIPLPSWDLVDFDAYARKPNMMTMLKGERYATIFTSRGCPYLCNYCHDIFSKRFVYRSVENVIAEIEMLYETYGVDEFQIVDDIFNLHKPRVKQIMGEVARRWPGKLKFTFPNGLRGDILDDEVLDAMQAAGTYAMSIAVETVTPRLQNLIEKHLNIEKTLRAINAANDREMMVSGFFMLGFPTETQQEMQATVDFALQSKLTVAHFFTVVPQPETPLYELALKENKAALDVSTRAEESGADYREGSSWYQGAYGFALSSYIKKANFLFYCNPKRVFRIWQRVPKKSLFQAFRKFVIILLIK